MYLCNVKQTTLLTPILDSFEANPQKTFTIMETTTNFNKTTKIDLYQIDPRLIKENDYNARTDFGDIEELAASIEENGLLNPVSVQQYKDENGETRYVLVDGARRLRAVNLLLDRGVQIHRIKALLLPKHLSEKELFIQHLVRNEGNRLNELEYAKAVYTMETKFGMSTNEIAKALGKNPSNLTYYRQHLDRPENESMVSSDSGPLVPDDALQCRDGGQ